MIAKIDPINQIIITGCISFVVAVIVAGIALWGVVLARKRQTKVELKLMQRVEIIEACEEYFAEQTLMNATLISCRRDVLSKFLTVDEKNKKLDIGIDRYTELVGTFAHAHARAMIRESTQLVFNGKTCREQIKDLTQLTLAFADLIKKLPSAINKGKEEQGKLMTQLDQASDCLSTHEKKLINSLQSLKNTLDGEIENMGFFYSKKAGN